jgi:hypothetical protein
LQWNDDRFAADQWADMISCGLNIPELHAEKHQIDRADRSGVIRRLDWAHDRFTTVALHPKAICAHGGEMGAARKENYVLPRSRQRRAERSTYAPGANYGDAHTLPPVSPNVLH